MNSKLFPKLVTALGGAFFAVVAQAQITFSFDFQNPGIGFNDPTLGAARQAALQDAATTLASYFTSSGPVTLTFTVVSENNSGSNTLASAGSDFANVSGGGFYRTVVQDKIISGNDANGVSADGTINWNWSHAWNITSSVGGSEYDFKSTAMHELLHAFGFLSATAGANNSGNNTWSTFDKFLTTSAGASLINQTTFAWVGPDSVLTGGGVPPAFATGGMYFSGANALAANSNNPVPIYSPGDTWQDGSSGSHTADNYFTGSNQLIMNAATSFGPGIRTISAIELGMLADMGYTVSAVPEPSTYALLLGLATMGWVAVRRRQQRA